MLSGAPRTKLHRILTCAILSQEHQTNIEQDFFLRNVVWSISDNIAQGFDVCNVVPIVLKQNCTEFFLTQYCLEPLTQHCIGLFPEECCPNLFYQLHIFYELLFFQVRAFIYQQELLLATLHKQPNSEIWMKFLPNPGNITPFVKSNKQKEGALREMHFYSIESSKML